MHHELDIMKEVVLNQNTMIGDLRREIGRKKVKIEDVTSKYKKLETKLEQRDEKIVILANKNEGQADEINQLRRRIEIKNDEIFQLKEESLAVGNSNVSLWSVIKLGGLIFLLIVLEHIFLYFWFGKESDQAVCLYGEQSFLDQNWKVKEILDVLLTYAVFYMFLSRKGFISCSLIMIFTKDVAIIFGLALFTRRFCSYFGMHTMNALSLLD